MHAVTLPRPDDYDAWRDAARGLLLADAPPEEVSWHVEGERDLFGDAKPPAVTGEPRALTVPRAFVELAQSVICNRDPERFALL